MSDRNHSVDEALRRIADRPQPTEEDIRLSRVRLEAAITAEKSGTTHTRLTRLMPVTVAFVIGVLLVGTLVVIETLNPTPLQAVMEEIARAAEATNPITFQEEDFVYIKTEETALAVIPREGISVEVLQRVPFDKDHLVYLLPTTRETWVGIGGTLQIRTTNHTPVFFNQADQEVYYAAGLDEGDAVEQTTVLTVRDPSDRVEWPTDPDSLDEAIRQSAVTDRGLPETLEYLDVAIDILADPLASADLRATTLRLIGELGGLETDGRAPAGGFRFKIDYKDHGVDTRLRLTVSEEGELILKEIIQLDYHPDFGIPAGTTILMSRHTDATIVDELGQAK